MAAEEPQSGVSLLVWLWPGLPDWAELPNQASLRLADRRILLSLGVLAAYLCRARPRAGPGLRHERPRKLPESPTTSRTPSSSC